MKLFILHAIFLGAVICTKNLQDEGGYFLLELSDLESDNPENYESSEILNTKLPHGESEKEPGLEMNYLVVLEVGRNGRWESSTLYIPPLGSIRKAKSLTQFLLNEAERKFKTLNNNIHSYNQTDLNNYYTVFQERVLALSELKAYLETHIPGWKSSEKACQLIIKKYEKMIRKIAPRLVEEDLASKDTSEK